jgi:outer membrane biosynthesis protein TonB
LATGLLVSAVVVAAFLFHSYRREFGESLIQLGERFAAKPQAQTLAMSAASPAVLPAPQMVLPAAPTVSPAPPKVLPAPAPIPVPPPEKVLAQPEKLVPQPLANPAKPQQAKLEPAGPAPAAPTAAGDPAPKAPSAAAAPAIPSSPPTISLPTTAPTTAVAPGSNLIPGKLGTVPKLEPANQPGVHTEASRADNSGSTSEMYFEVGRFKNQWQAHDETDKLAHLGFPVTAVQKGFLWTNSYHVLVGPYGDEEQAKATHANLVSSGFKPRPFERGSRNFTLLSSLTLNGARTPQGDYTISWESYVSDASVKFMHNNYVVTTADGRWVKRDVKYDRDAYVYRRNVDGSRTLLEIHFGGMRQALVFGKSS